MIKTLYEKFVLPKLCDKCCGTKPINYQRNKVVPLAKGVVLEVGVCLLYTSPSPRDVEESRMPSSA